MSSPSFDESSEKHTSSESIEAARTSRPRGHAWLAWIAIVATVAFTSWLHTRGGNDDVDESSIVMPEIQAKYLVGVAGLSLTSKESTQEQIDLVFGRGPLRQQLIGVVLTAELAEPKAALKRLVNLQTEIEEESVTATDADKEVATLLGKCLQARIDKQPVTSNLSEDEQRTVQKLFSARLGWAGRLALVPHGTIDQAERSRLLNQSRWTLIAIMGIFIAGGMAMLCGTLLQITWWIFAALGRLTPGIRPLRGEQRIYAETFAVWMALYLALSYLLAEPLIARWGLISIVIPQVGSLAALAWPIFRGLRWSEIREDLGLYLGPQGWTAPFVGIGAYLSALPLLGIAMIVTLIMMQIANQFATGDDSVATPVHPIVEPILRGNWTIRLQLLFVAIFAAVPEEIMFRGVLYRHLREAGMRFGYLPGVVLAALLSSFVFAVIHPQGLFGIPILMTLAMVFTFVREWRGSIVPSMVTHALVNTGTTMILLLIAD